MQPLSGSVRFGVTTTINPVQTIAALETNLALLKAKQADEANVQKMNDRNDPISLHVDIFETGQAKASITTQNTRQSKTVELNDTTQVPAFWQTILGEMKTLLPRPKTPQELDQERLTYGAFQLNRLLEALGKSEYKLLNARTSLSEVGKSVYQMAEVEVDGKPYTMLHVSPKNTLEIGCQATGELIRYTEAEPSWFRLPFLGRRNANTAEILIRTREENDPGKTYNISNQSLSPYDTEGQKTLALGATSKLLMRKLKDNFAFE